MGIVIDFPLRDAASRDAAFTSRREASQEIQGQDLQQNFGKVVILPVIRIERYDEAPAGLFPPRRGDPARKRKRRASRS